MAAQLGLKNGKTARARWNTIARTKINNAASAGGVSKAGPSKKKAAPKKAAGEGKRFTHPHVMHTIRALLTPPPDAEKPVREKRGRKAKKEADVKVEEKTEEEEEEEAEEELV